MADSPIAIIDLGTNTFHLFIAEFDSDGNWATLHKEKHFVKLAEESRSRIGAKPMQRAVHRMNSFSRIAKSYNCKSTLAYATAGLRQSDNRHDFIDAVRENTGIKIEIIDGDREAELICLGVRQAVEFGDETVLIMDIGGGSIEFIICDKTSLKWRKSYPIGAANLKLQFHQRDPIPTKELEALNKFLDSTLSEVFNQCQNNNVKTLIGASGSFDTLIECQAANFPDKQFPPHEIDIQGFLTFHNAIIKLSLDERQQIKGMHPQRAEMMVVASAVIQFVLKTCSIQKLLHSNMAMKEGIAWQLAHKSTTIRKFKF